MVGHGSITLIDYDAEVAASSFYTGDVTAVSLPGLLTEFGALRTAIEGITLGVVRQEALKVFDTRLSNSKPSDKEAQRETKWLVVYEDNLPFFDDPVNAIPNAGYLKIFTMEIGTADLSLLNTDSNTMNITSGAGATFKTAFEAIARSPYGGTVTVRQVQHVGRNT